MIPVIFDLSMEYDAETYLSINSQNKLMNIIEIIVNGKDNLRMVFRNQTNFKNIYTILSA